MTTALDPQLRSVLELERRLTGVPGGRAGAIRRALGISPTRYHQLLGRAIDLPEALAFDPGVVHRLRRLRAARRARHRRLGPSTAHG